MEALKHLKVTWLSESKVSQLYEQIDIAVHSYQVHNITPDHIGGAIF